MDERMKSALVELTSAMLDADDGVNEREWERLKDVWAVAGGNLEKEFFPVYNEVLRCYFLGLQILPRHYPFNRMPFLKS